MIRVVVLSLLVSGCTWFKREPQIVYEQVRVTCEKPVQARPPFLMETPPTVIEDQYGIAWFAFSAQGWASLASNIQEMRRYQAEQRTEIRHYEDCNAEEAPE